MLTWNKIKIFIFIKRGAKGTRARLKLIDPKWTDNTMAKERKKTNFTVGLLLNVPNNFNEFFVYLRDILLWFYFAQRCFLPSNLIWQFRFQKRFSVFKTMLGTMVYDLRFKQIERYLAFLNYKIIKLLNKPKSYILLRVFKYVYFGSTRPSLGYFYRTTSVIYIVSSSI